jgi:hypothetical protein
MSVISFGPEFREALNFGPKSRRLDSDGDTDDDDQPGYFQYKRGRGGGEAGVDAPGKLRPAHSAPAEVSYEPPTPSAGRRSLRRATSASFEVDEDDDYVKTMFMSTEIVFQILGVDGEEDTLQIIFDTTENPPQKVILVNRGHTTSISIDNLMEELSEEFDKLCSQIGKKMPDGAVHDIFGAPGSAAFGAIKHLMTSRPCETIVNIGVCAFLLYAVISFLPSTSQSSGFFDWSKKIACSKLFRFGPEAAFRTWFGWAPTSVCTQANAFADECAAEIWQALFLSLYPERSNANKNIRLASAGVSSAGVLKLGLTGEWKDMVKKIQSYLVANSLGPMLRSLSERICGFTRLSRSNAPTAGDDASGGAGSSGVHTPDAGARQDGSGGAPSKGGRASTRSTASQPAAATTSGYPGPWKRGLGGEFREIERDTFINRNNKPVDADGAGL